MTDERTDATTRRTVLRAATGSLALAAGTGAASAATTDCGDCDCPSVPRRGVADATGQAEVCTCVYDFQPFDPTVLHVSPGTRVTWKNAGSLFHNVVLVAGTGDEEPRRLGAFGAGGTVCHTFDDLGTYYVRCEVALHEAAMHQVVNVGTGPPAAFGRTDEDVDRAALRRSARRSSSAGTGSPGPTRS